MNQENLTPLQKAQLKQKEMRQAGLLTTRSPLEKFVTNPRLGRAVKFFCYECNGYSRSAANNCENKDCALWLFRKGRSTPDAIEVEEWRQIYLNHMKNIGEDNPLQTNSTDDDSHESFIEDDMQDE